MAAPVLLGIHIEVLTVEIDPLGFDQRVDPVDEPVSRLVVAQVEQVRRDGIVVGQQPVGVLLGQFRSGKDPLRLEPDDRADSPLTGVVGDRPQAVRESVGVGFPRPDLPPRAAARIPAGVHPPVVQIYLLLGVPVDEHDLRGLVGVPHLGVPVRAASGDMGPKNLPPRAGNVVFHHPGAPDVLRLKPRRAVPVLHDDHRGADLFPGEQLHVCIGLSGRYAGGKPAASRERGLPLPRPADDDDPPLDPRLKVEIGQIDPAGPARREKTALGPRPQRCLQRGVVVQAVPAPFEVTQEEFPLPVEPLDRFKRWVELLRPHGFKVLARKRRGQGEDILENLALFGSGVLERQLPLHRRKIEILHAVADHPQAVGGVERQGPKALGPLGSVGDGFLPLGEEIAGTAAGVGKLKRILGLAGEVFFFLNQFQGGERHGGSVLPLHGDIGPVGLIARDAVPAVADL